MSIVPSDTDSSTSFECLTQFLKSYISDICIKEEFGNQITYTIIDDVEHKKLFPVMFAALDENKDRFQIKSYGLSSSTLDQVFLRVADEKKRKAEYELLTCGKRIKNRIKKCCRKNEMEQVNNDQNTNARETENNQEQVNEHLIGMIKYDFLKQLRHFGRKLLSLILRRK